MKDGTEMNVVSGFRVYDTRGASKIERGGDAPTYALTYAAWEPAGVPPVEEPEEEDQEEETGESGETPSDENGQDQGEEGEQGTEPETTTFEEAVDKAQVTSLGFDNET